MIGDVKPPPDWPVLRIIERIAAQGELQSLCRSPWYVYVSACAIPDFDARTCLIVYNGLPDVSVVQHEWAHCEGWDHVGETTLTDRWSAWKKNHGIR